MNIKNILSEKGHTIKGHPDPILILSALNSSKLSKCGENTVMVPGKEHWIRMEKDIFTQLGQQVKVEVGLHTKLQHRIHDFLTGRARCRFLRRVLLF